METVYLMIPLAPLLGAILAGLFGHWIGRRGAHSVTILGVAVSFALALWVLKHHVLDGAPDYNATVYTWLLSEGLSFQIGFLVDHLTALMITVVTFVSLMVHIYTIGYMADDPGYQRFFSYIALFTFAMLMLVMSNNFLQLFFGWEAVGVVSYLLIGFWYTRESAIYANLKAFLVNRVGDLGFLLGIGLVVHFFDTLDYATAFQLAPHFVDQTFSVGIADWPVITAICLLLFVGAMGKSAQMPLHVWLPDSMEGPTPISALIHAATMVTAGIFMVARMSPLYELSETALTVVLGIGTATAFFMGLLGLVQHDIKRVVAYSTLSQLGYMTAALGASAYSVAIFHLMTHAFFKALLFLAAGSVIIALHHQQDMRYMGGLKRYLPITYWTSLIGSLALIGFPGFSGFFSKDLILEAVHASQLPGAAWAYALLLTGVFVTALYSFRMFFLVFHGPERRTPHAGHGDEHGHLPRHDHPHEPPRVVTWPLILLAIPSLVIGYFTIGPLVFGNFFAGAIQVEPGHDFRLHAHFNGPLSFILHGLQAAPVWLALAGVMTAWWVYLKRPGIAEACVRRFQWLYRAFVNKYGFDAFNERFFAGGSRGLGRILWRAGDIAVIDGALVNGSARVVGWFSGVLRQIQTGYLYHYAFMMIIGLLVMISWFVVRFVT